MDSDAAIVQAAFKRAAELELLYGDLVPARAIEELFEHQGASLRLANRAQGIFKPAIMQEGAISIKTTISRDGSDNIYDDREVDDGYYHYSLQAGDPRGVNNKYLWQSMERKQPLIYFHAVAPAGYKPIWQFRGQYTYLVRGILAITCLPVSQFAQNDSANSEAAGSSLIGILSPDFPVHLVHSP